MKLLLAFAIIINSYVIANELQTGSLANQETFTILRRGLHPFKVFPSSLDKRFRRNPPVDLLKDYIDKLQTISRLTNVIYLQQGISNGSVFKTEELISELLHFGPVKLKDILDLDLDKIKKAFDVMKELPSKLKKNDVSDLEKVFLDIGTLQMNINGLSEIKWDGKDAFAADLKKIEEGELDFSLVADLETHLTNWKSSYGQVKNLITQGSFLQTDMVFVSFLGNASSELKAMIKKLQQKTSFFEFTNGGEAVDAINPLIRILSSVEFLKTKNLATTDKWFDLFDNNAKQIAEDVKQMSAVRPNLEVIRNVSFSRMHPQLYTSTEYTHGLPDGYDDVGKVTKAFNDAWLRKIVQNGSLDKSYPSVQSLESYINPIQKHLKAPKKVLELLSNVMRESEILDIFNGLSKEKVKSVTNCFNGHRTDSPNTLVKDLETSAKQIDEEHENLVNLLKTATNILKNNENDLESLIQLLAKAKQGDASSFGPTIQSFDKFHASSKIYTEFSNIIPAIINGVKLKQFATTAAANLEKVTAYETTATKYFGYLGCLLKNKDAPAVIDAVKNSGNLRKSSTGHASKYTEGLQAVQSVVNTKTGLSDLQKTIDEAKGKTTLESSLLNLLEKAGNHSETLGLATRGAANMKALIDRKAEFAVFEDKAKLIKSEVKKHSNKFNTDESKLLNELAALGDSIKTMYVGLTTWRAAIADVSLSTLENLWEVFKTIKHVNGITEDLSKMSLVLQKLIDFVEAQDQGSSSINSLKAVKAALITLDGLHFSNYVVSSEYVQTSLSALNSFFIEYAKAEVIKRSATPSPQIVFVPEAGANIAEVEEKEGKRDQLIIIIVVACVVIGVIVTAVIIIVCCCCKKIDDDDIILPVEDADPPLEVRVWFMRKYGTQVAKHAKSREQEIAKLLPGIKKRELEVSAADQKISLSGSVEGNDRKTASGDEETDETSTSFLEGDGNEPEVLVDLEATESSDNDDDKARNMAGGNEEEAEDSDPEVVNLRVSESSEDEEDRDMADEELRLLAGGNKMKNNPSMNLTIQKDAVKTPAKSKEPATPKTPEVPKAAATPEASVDPKVQDDPNATVDEKASTDQKQASASTSNESTNPKLPDEVNAPEVKAPTADDQGCEKKQASASTSNESTNPKLPDEVNAPSNAPEVRVPPADDQGCKSDVQLAAEVKVFSEFQFFMVDKDMKECNKPEDANQIVQKHKTEVRERIWLNEDNRVKLPTILTKKKGTLFKNDFFHGNIAKYRNGRKIIACQGPKVVAADGKIPTVDKFYYVAKANQVRAILMLCDFKEPVKDRDGKVDMKTKCDEYFPLEEKAMMTFTGFTVTCTKKTVDDDLITRELTITYAGEEPYELTHYHYVGWPDKSTPTNPFRYAMLWNTLRKLNATLLIHCSAGIGRTGTALLVEELYQHIYYSNGTATGTGIVDFGAALRNVRKYRARAVQSSTQFTFAIMVVFDLFFAYVNYETERKTPTPQPTEGMERVSWDDYQLFQKYRKVWVLLCPDPPPVFEGKKGGDKKSTMKTGDGEKSKEVKVEGKKSVVKAADGQKSKEKPVDAKKSVVKAAGGEKSTEKTVDAKKSTVKEPTAGKKK